MQCISDLQGFSYKLLASHLRFELFLLLGVSYIQGWLLLGELQSISHFYFQMLFNIIFVLLLFIYDFLQSNTSGYLEVK